MSVATKFYPLLALASAAAIILGGCSNVNSPAPGSKADLDLEAEIAQSTVRVAGPEVALEEQLADALSRICEDLSPFTADPANWVVETEGGEPYRAYVDGGDGGYVVLRFSPGPPEATISIDPEYEDETNTVLFYSGCVTLAEDPNISVKVEDTSTVEEIELFVVPNFIGWTVAEVDRWFFLNSSKVRVNPNEDYGFTPDAGCAVNKYGIVISQTPMAGAEIRNDSSGSLRLKIDCGD
jgi:hypothetical protein